jgi:hypothetical protein
MKKDQSNVPPGFRFLGPKPHTSFPGNFSGSTKLPPFSGKKVGGRDQIRRLPRRS